MQLRYKLVPLNQTTCSDSWLGTCLARRGNSWGRACLSSSHCLFINCLVHLQYFLVIIIDDVVPLNPFGTYNVWPFFRYSYVIFTEQQNRSVHINNSNISTAITTTKFTQAIDLFLCVQSVTSTRGGWENSRKLWKPEA